MEFNYYINTIIARSVATKQPSKVIAGLRLGCFVLLRKLAVLAMTALIDIPLHGMSNG